MNDILTHTIKTGGDPRTLPDYAALRDELSKLTHPARPDVDWQYVEKRALSLFRQNGVELQTAAWYTLARLQCAGVSGLNEGLELVAALINHQWVSLWPQPVQARVEILSSLSVRLQHGLRALSLNAGDLSQLYRAEELLGTLNMALERQALKHLCQFETVRTLIHISAARLESSGGNAPVRERMLSGVGYPAADQPQPSLRWVYVAEPEPQTEEKGAVSSVPARGWKAFVGGMGLMLAACAIAFWGWRSLNASDPAERNLAASLAPFPVTLTPEQLNTLRQHTPAVEGFIHQVPQALARLDKLSPDWNIVYARQLLSQAQVLRPEQAKPLVAQWQQQRQASALPAEKLTGWHQGMTTLQQLSDRLNALDKAKGKYITVSELKSVVFSAMQSFDQAVPAEEQLRALSQYGAEQPLPVGEKAQLEMHLRQLIARYAEINQQR